VVLVFESGSAIATSPVGCSHGNRFRDNGQGRTPESATALESPCLKTSTIDGSAIDSTQLARNWLLAEFGSMIRAQMVYVQVWEMANVQDQNVVSARISI
jgi:hypothetical protein